MNTSGLVIILFTDLVGSTELNSEIGDMAADELRRLHFVDLREAVAATDGTEVKTIGDAIMVSYSGATDALNGAVEMQRAVGRRNRRAAGQDLEMRVGVSAGDATFEEGDWFGTPVVEAARLCAEADPNQILVSDLVRALAGSRVMHKVKSIGSRELKGLPEAVDVSEVEWETDTIESGVPLPGFVDTDPAFQFAGRVAERDVLRTAWKQAAEAQRRVVLISGEPGIGKTRLVTEFVRFAHDEGGVVLWGRCDEELDVAYQPFAEALGQFCSSITDERLLAEVAPFAAEISKLVPDLSQRISGITAAIAADADAERHRLFESVADVLAAMAQTDPIVIVLDDVHWADRSSLLLLRHLLRRPEPIRLLILATYRDTDLDRSHPLSDVLADLRRQTGVERLDLRGLDEGEVTSFMESAAGHELEPTAVELAKAIHTETEGNPFFLGEMIRHLAESGLIVQRDGRWVSDYSLADAGIPEGIREVVGRRLSNLGESANDALSIAAVIGPEFDMATVEAAGGPSGDDLFDALDEAVAASVVREVKGSFGRYAFAHALVRSTLYEELSTNRRVRMHWRIGVALESRHSSRIDSHLDQLAHHFVEGALAGDPLVAIDYCVRAAEKAVSELAYEAATRSYDRALSTFELVDDPDMARRCDIETALTATLHDARNTRSRDAGLVAAASARSLDDGARLASACISMGGHLPTHLGHIDEEVVALIRESLAAVDDAPTAVRAQLLSMLALELQWGPHADERTSSAHEALDIARDIGDTEVLSTILSAAWVLFDGTRPYVDELRDFSAEAVELARPGTASWMYALRDLMATTAALGDTDEALRLLDRFAAAATDSRLGNFIWLARNDASMMASLVGDLESAERGALDGIAFGQRIGLADDRITGSFGGLIYSIRRTQGRIGELVPTLEGLVESSPRMPVWRVALSGALSLSRRYPEANEHFLWLAANKCANVPHDIQYPTTICGLARIAPSVEAPPDICEYLYDALLPFAGTMNFTGSSIGDANDMGLGCVAGLLGRHEVADGHYRAAIELVEGARALPYELHCRADWANTLEQRGDTDLALEQAAIVVQRADGQGMDGPDGYVARCVEMLEG